MRRVPFLAAGLAALALAACQPVAQKQPSEKAATGDVCSQLGAVATALEQVNSLKPTSTVGEAQSANKALGKAIKGLKGAEAELEAQHLALERARLGVLVEPVRESDEILDLLVREIREIVKALHRSTPSERQTGDRRVRSRE